MLGKIIGEHLTEVIRRAALVRRLAIAREDELTVLQQSRLLVEVDYLGDRLETLHGRLADGNVPEPVAGLAVGTGEVYT